ncbi:MULTISPECIES: GNAT family N-acetyltransferase [Glycomyces]|uniref:GNAT family N-acetyltransferase n=2 Tax=Glycomyces TaxID=58113 RepID=A0A9X3PR48_9ACTN|nr:GNAT family N-acetyltransferase [Glycomyces lechevalierae]MDA1388293.1 GNAT family N-acetyltransferase [Glycomyces lechevalierae]MDR7339058.1 putative GNAT family acetyltransferase [Glycomyces lechevalierae]
MSVKERLVVQVTDAPEKSRYEAYVDGELVGYTEYRHNDGTTMLSITEVPEELQNKGIGAALARFALAAARESGRRIEPVDPFIAGWLERHPEHAHMMHEKAIHLGEET